MSHLPSYDANLVSQLIQEEQPLVALYMVFNIRGIPCTLHGEQNTILTFTTSPLSYTLRITGKDHCHTVRVIKDRDNISRAYDIVSPLDLPDFCQGVMQFRNIGRRSLVRGYLHPVPKTDAELLSILGGKNPGTHVEKFEEASRMISDGCLLNAVVALMGPFGLQPTEYDGRFVVFQNTYLRTNEVRAGLRISRYSEFGSRIPAPHTPREGEAYKSLALDKCVTVQFVRSHGHTQATEDHDRVLRNMLAEAGYIDEVENEEFPEKALLYDLSKPSEMLALVQRTLQQRDSEQRQKMPFEFSRFMGKQKSHVIMPQEHPDPELAPRRYAYWLRKKADRDREVEFDHGNKKHLREDHFTCRRHVLLKQAKLEENLRAGREAMERTESRSDSFEERSSDSSSDDEESSSGEESRQDTPQASPRRRDFSQDWNGI